MSHCSLSLVFYPSTPLLCSIDEDDEGDDDASSEAGSGVPDDRSQIYEDSPLET